MCNAFLHPNEKNESQTVYPMQVFYCENCHLVQLGIDLPNSVVFGKDFNYLSGATKSLIKHFDELAAEVVSVYGIKKDDGIVDIGSNDGTYLLSYKKLGYNNVTGVDGAPKPAAQAEKAGVHTIAEHFNEKVADTVLKEMKKIKVVNAMSVIPHTSDMHSFMRGIKKLLKDEATVLVVRFPYLPSLIDDLEYDTIYHEHKRYFSLTTFKTLLEMYGIYILDAKKTDVYGGSILIFSSSQKRDPSKRAKEILMEEERFSEFATYAKFAENVKRMKYELIKILADAKLNKKKIIGLGAPMKSATLLNYCGITPDILDYLTEVNQLKIGCLSPGVCIPVVDELKLTNVDADYALVLSWNIADDLMKIWRKKAPKLKYIIPIPEPVIAE